MDIQSILQKQSEEMQAQVEEFEDYVNRVVKAMDDITAGRFDAREDDDLLLKASDAAKCQSPHASKRSCTASELPDMDTSHSQLDTNHCTNVKDQTDNSVTLKAKADAAYRQGDFELAVTWYEAALADRENGNSVPLRTNIAIAYLKLEKFSKARYHCERALELDPTSWKARLRLGAALLGLKDFLSAETILMTLCQDQGLRSFQDQGRTPVEWLLECRKYECESHTQETHVPSVLHLVDGLFPSRGDSKLALDQFWREANRAATRSSCSLFLILEKDAVLAGAFNRMEGDAELMLHFASLLRKSYEENREGKLTPGFWSVFREMLEDYHNRRRENLPLARAIMKLFPLFAADSCYALALDVFPACGRTLSEALRCIANMSTEEMLTALQFLTEQGWTGRWSIEVASFLSMSVAGGDSKVITQMYLKMTSSLGAELQECAPKILSNALKLIKNQTADHHHLITTCWPLVHNLLVLGKKSNEDLEEDLASTVLLDVLFAAMEETERREPYWSILGTVSSHAPIVVYDRLLAYYASRKSIKKTDTLMVLAWTNLMSLGVQKFLLNILRLLSENRRVHGHATVKATIHEIVQQQQVISSMGPIFYETWSRKDMAEENLKIVGNLGLLLTSLLDLCEFVERNSQISWKPVDPSSMLKAAKAHNLIDDMIYCIRWLTTLCDDSQLSALSKSVRKNLAIACGRLCKMDQVMVERARELGALELFAISI